MSGNSGARSGSRGSAKRRRKRRSGQGPKGNGFAQGNAAAAATTPQDPGPVQARTVSGSVDQITNPQARPADAEGSAPGSGKRRKKRRRGHGSPPAGSEGANGRVAGIAEGHGNPHNAEAPTSFKSKKAARRRGRRRRQAENGPANGQPVHNGSPAATPSPDLRSDGQVLGQTPPERAAKQADIRVPKDGSEQFRRHRPGYQNGYARNAQNGAPLYAALDLGTNNCRLLIARPEERGFRVVDAYSRIVRLGEGVGSNRRLSDAAMDRAIDALANCHRKLADRGVSRSRLIATEACRAAENGAEFIDRVKSETGLALEVVNRETEARLAVAGCASLVDHDADGVILFDIGGGSSEIVWLDLRNRCGARGYALTRFIRSWISLPVGVVNLAERHGGVHVTPEVFEAMIEDAAGHLASFSLASSLTEAISSGKVHMLGTSGTVTTLAGVHLGLKRYDRRRVDGTWLEDGDVARMIDQLRDMPYEARVENPCIGADRADLVLAGCAILEAIRRRWSCSRLRVADRGLREGILTELMAADGVWAHRKSGNRHERGRQRNRA
ncbi:Ppx/GppA phosphatase family protein [Roseibium salinum]|uniref:Ppx/GppA phosphatase family protein n=1 Tax=Roseibium salinum TaxID=1604349 RepID=A0ABT3R0L7_9HYPH|nr:Ppx/GppA phosphatase family protein [Roseibium sp. DSM 29163]MCX2722749.1 Ppx/GppA phosphatase family protein [Roseibium sp. DSM 29163]